VSADERTEVAVAAARRRSLDLEILGFCRFSHALTRFSLDSRLWFCLDFLVGIGTFQGVTGVDAGKK